MSQSQQDPPSASADSQCHLKVIEVDFKNGRPKYKITVKLEVDGQTLIHKFGKEGVVRWECNRDFVPSARLKITVKEVHFPKRKKVFAVIDVNMLDHAEDRIIEVEDEQRKVVLKLTFDVPEPIAAVTEVLLEEVPETTADAEVHLEEATADTEVRLEEATRGAESKPVLLDKLGRFREFVDTVLKLSLAVAELHPIAKLAVGAVNVLYEKCKAQEEYRAIVRDLLEDMTLHLPFTKTHALDESKYAVTKETLGKMLKKIEEASKFVDVNSTQSVIGELLSSEPKMKEANGLRDGFRKLKEVYDWCIKAESWRTSLNIERIGESQLLAQLDHAKKAYYSPGLVCLKGTREGVLEHISQWASSMDASTPKLFWLYGLAGSGKSSIGHSVAQMFDRERLLLGCFFCKRDDPVLRDPGNVIPTIAHYLAHWHKPYRTAILPVLQGADRVKLDAKEVQWQFDFLIKNPLTALSQSSTDLPPKPLIIVIDALDECGDSAHSRSQLAGFLKLTSAVPLLKVFITSRLLPEIGEVLSQASLCHDMSSEDGIQKDILSYTKSCVEMYKVPHVTEEEIHALADRASGLFIWTSTVFRFISELNDKHDAVEDILSAQPLADNPEAELDNLYTTVIQTASGDKVANREPMKAILGIISITAKNKPLPAKAIFDLLPKLLNGKPISDESFSSTLGKLQSVLYTDHAMEDSIRVCHPSFLDFMSQKSRSDQFWTDPEELDLHMAVKCLEIMKSQLKFNICHLESSYVANNDIPDLQNKIASYIPKSLQYSCLYWMNHVASSRNLDSAAKTMKLAEDVFCHTTALYWLEILSFIQSLKSGINILQEAALFHKNQDKISTATTDLYRFISAFYEAIAISTPHLYISALSWAPTESFVSKHLYHRFSNQSLATSGKKKDWGSDLWTATTEYSVECVAYSPDGKHIVSGSEDGTIHIWDAESGTMKGEPLTGHSKGVNSVAFSPDGECIVSGSWDETIRIWDAESGTTKGEPLTGHSSGVTSVAFSPDGKYIVSGSYEETIRIWNAESGTAKGEPLTGQYEGVISVAFSPDGKYIVSGSESDNIHIWDTESGTANGEPLAGYHVNSVAYSPDGKHIVSSSDEDIQIWDVESRTAKGESLTGHLNRVNSVAFSPDGKYIVSGSDDKTICIWDAVSGIMKGEPLTGHSQGVNSVAFSPDGKHIVSGSDDKTIRIWDAESGAAKGEPLTGHSDLVKSVAFSPDGKHIVSGSWDNTIRIWDAESGAAKGEPLTGRSTLFTSVAFSPDGKHIVSGSNNKTIRIWDAESGIAKGEPLRGHSDWVRSVAFSPDGKHIVSGSDDNTICIWDAESGTAKGEPLTGHSAWINSVSFSPDGRYIVSGSFDETIRIWDAESGAAKGEPLTGHSSGINSVAFSPDGKHIVSGSDDYTIHIWDAESGAAKGESLTGHLNRVNSVAFSPDGKYIVSGSDDKTICIWDAVSGIMKGEPLTGHSQGVNSVAFSPDGKYVLSGSRDSTIRIWDAESGTARGVIKELNQSLPDVVPSDGWMRTPAGEGLLLWVPQEYRLGVTDRSIVCIPPNGPQCPVRFDWSKFCHGPSWTNIMTE